MRFLIGLRHEIEHQMTSRIDDYLSARFQACCLNYNTHIKQLFGNLYGIENHLTFSLQFSSISEEHANQLKDFSDLPANIAAYINAYDESLNQDDFNDVRYSYRVLYVPKTANNKGQADRVIEFLRSDSVEAQQLNKEYVVIKDREKRKYLPTQIWRLMQERGFVRFGPHQHTLLWKELNAKDPDKAFGVMVEKTWYWYDAWMKEVENHCQDNGDQYRQ